MRCLSPSAVAPALARSSRSSDCSRAQSEAALAARVSQACNSCLAWPRDRSESCALARWLASSDLTCTDPSLASDVAKSTSSRSLELSLFVRSACLSSRRRSCCSSSRSPCNRSFSTAWREVCLSRAAASQVLCRSASSALLCSSLVVCSLFLSASDSSDRALRWVACRLPTSASFCCLRDSISPAKRFSSLSACLLSECSEVVQESFCSKRSLSSLSFSASSFVTRSCFSLMSLSLFSIDSMRRSICSASCFVASPSRRAA
mmetsp:Transcript_140609/g.365972  ORF Transcript_140609/g.365972 Transcript_140609/m.365972 type:complete len:262 (+) Transcript_140609:414-1199(+)